MTTTDTPTYHAIVAERGFNPGGLADTSLAAVEQRSIPADRERGARIVARLGEEDGSDG